MLPFDFSFLFVPSTAASQKMVLKKDHNEGWHALSKTLNGYKRVIFNMLTFYII